MTMLPGRQRGATIVEFSVTLSLFMMIVIAIFEFSILIMNISRANEVTRDLARLAIVHDPVCDIFGEGCPGAGVLNCASQPAAVVTLTLAGTSTGCDATADTACRLYTHARAIMPQIQAEQIEVSYSCSGAGNVYRPENMPIPLVTVALRNVSHSLFSPTILGLESEVAIPAFETSRTGEGMHTVRMVRN